MYLGLIIVSKKPTKNVGELVFDHFDSHHIQALASGGGRALKDLPGQAAICRSSWASCGVRGVQMSCEFRGVQMSCEFRSVQMSREFRGVPNAVQAPGRRKCRASCPATVPRGKEMERKHHKWSKLWIRCNCACFRAYPAHAQIPCFGSSRAPAHGLGGGGWWWRS